MTSITTMLTVLLGYIPIYFVWIIGIVVAIVNFRRYPKVSLLTIIAMTVCIVTTLIFSSLNYVLPSLITKYGLSASTMGLVYSIISIVRSLISAFAWGLIIAAIFGWRSKGEYLAAEDSPLKK